MSGMYSERRARDDFAHSVFSDSDFDDNTSDGKDSEDGKPASVLRIFIKL